MSNNLLSFYRAKLEILVRQARADGVVLEIRSVSPRPYAMRNQIMVFDVRLDRRMHADSKPSWPAASTLTKDENGN